MDVMEMLNETKQHLNDVIDAIFAASVIGDLGVERDTIKAEFEAVGLFVAGADNDISSNEVDLFNYLFDFDIPIEEMPKVIPTLKELYNGTIVQLQMSGWMICKAIDMTEGTQDATDQYIQTMSLIMTVFSIVDGNMDASEEKFIENFENRLKRDRL